MTSPKSKNSSSADEQGPAALVSETAPFPVPLDGFFHRWNGDGTLKNRLRAALALAYEVAHDDPVLLGSPADRDAVEFLEKFLGKQNRMRGGLK